MNRQSQSTSATGTAPAQAARVPRAIEVGFPIVEINRLAEPERNSFKPIYQMHKWFARRASCVFRAILLGALKPAVQTDGTPTDLMAEFYKDHSHDPDTQNKLVLDPFMGGGTTVVEALRLGCRVVGIDLNPIAWFVVKTEVEAVNLDALQQAYERLAARPVAWNGNKPLRETLLDLYKTEVAPGVDADVIYTFWVKHAICTDPNCKREVPLFKDWFIARKTVKVRHHKDAMCPACRKSFSWELQNASLIADAALIVQSSQDRSSAWVYAAPPKDKKSKTLTVVDCPHCRKSVQLQKPERKAERKPVDLAVLLCPECEAVWQMRGPLPEGKLQCPACKHSYDPNVGNVPDKGSFQCRCGNRDKIITSIRQLPQDQRLPTRPYALQAYVPAPKLEESETPQGGLFDNTALYPLSLKKSKANGRHANALKNHLQLPDNGKFFTRFSPADQARLRKSESQWDAQKAKLPYPKSAIPLGEKTKSGLLAHHYNHWHDMFAPRQLLALSTLLDGIMAEADEKLREVLLCAFSNTLEGNNMFVRNIISRTTPGGTAPAGVFARHDYQPKVTSCEQNVWGTVSGNNTFVSRMEMLEAGVRFAGVWPEGPNSKALDPLRNTERAELLADNSINALGRDSLIPEVVITDPPYVGNVNYAELADFFYVWLRLALKDRYSGFSPEYTPKQEEIIENDTRGKSRSDFYSGLSAVFRQINRRLPEHGLLVFTFHHTDQDGDVWEGLLQSLCDSGFEVAAVYPVHAERESSLHLLDKESISYDLIHVCRKRVSNPEPRSWAGIRQEIRRRARSELAAIEAGRYGGQPLAEPDVRLICIGKCLELYSAHYDKVLDHEGKTLPLHQALQDIASIVDQLVTRERPLPPELEDIDALSYAWLRLLASRHTEISVDKLSKGLRAMQVTAEDFKKAGLITRGRATRGRAYEVKQPRARLELALERLRQVAPDPTQTGLFEPSAAEDWGDLHLMDLLHALIGLAEAGESVLSVLERFENRRAAILAGLRFVRTERSDWQPVIDRVLAVIEGAPLLRTPARQESRV